MHVEIGAVHRYPVVHILYIIAYSYGKESKLSGNKFSVVVTQLGNNSSIDVGVGVGCAAWGSHEGNWTSQSVFV